MTAGKPLFDHSTSPPGVLCDVCDKYKPAPTTDLYDRGDIRVFMCADCADETNAVAVPHRV